MIKIVQATKSHMKELAANIRANDKTEIVGMGADFDAAIELTWNGSLMSKAALVDGKVAAVWGVGGSALGGIGQPWLLTTPAFERIKFRAVRQASKELRGWFMVFRRLENHVDASYRGACRFLEVLGFRLGEPSRLPTGMMVRRFWMER